MSENQEISDTPSLPPLSGTHLHNLFYNLLPLHCRPEEVEMRFTCHPGPGLYPFTPQEVPSSLVCGFSRGSLPPHYYTSAAPGGEGVAVQVRLADYPALARLWCMQHIRRLLMPVVDYCRHDGPFATQFWCCPARMEAAPPEVTGSRDVPGDGPAGTGGTSECHAFHRFTVKVLHQNGSASPVLLVACNGTGYIHDSGLYDFPGSRHGKQRISGVAFRGQILRRRELPEAAMYHLDEVHPVVSGRLKRRLPMNGRPGRETGAQDVSFQLVTAFLQRHLLTGEADCPGLFRSVVAGAAGRVASAGSPLLFGEGGLSHCPVEGMTAHGPLHLPAGTHFTCFTICFEEDRPLAGKLYKYLFSGENGWHLGRFMRVPLFYSSRHAIVLRNGNNVRQQLMRRLSQMVFDARTVWCGFYIHPAHCRKNLRVQDLIAELLLYRGVVVRNIEGSLLKDDFTPHLPRLGFDMVTLLGGTPWGVSGSWLPDPIVRFSVCRPAGISGPATGTARLFAPGGRFSGASRFNPANECEWGGLAAELLMRWERTGHQARRLVVHLPHRLQPREMESLRVMLEEQRPGLQVVVMVIRPCGSNHLRVFTSDGTVPPDGTWVRCSDSRYLLYTGSRPYGQHEAQGPAVPLSIRFTLFNGGEQTIGEMAPVLLEQAHSLGRTHLPAGRPIKTEESFLYIT